MFKNTRNAALAALAIAFAAVASPAAATTGSTGPDFSALTSAVDFTSTQGAILSVGALAIGLGLVVLGIRKVMQMVRGS